MENLDLDEIIIEILDNFTQSFRNDENVIAVLLTGSYAHSKPSKNSDLDVYIILFESEWRERGNTFAKGYEIEYFINPLIQVYETLERDKDQLRPTTAHLLKFSKILYLNDSFVDDFNKLLETASSIYNSRLPKVSTKYIEIAKYSLDDSLKDLDDVQQHNDLIAYTVITNDLIRKSIEVFYKLKQVKQDKSKSMNNQLNTLDPSFNRLLSSVSEQNYSYNSLADLVGYVESLLGGKRTKEWKLRTRCTV
ncbi:MAG: nucleotidyltransferase domain-containing protein [Candidatus Kariarchaeaceae archaeon]|jgi:predicted nucleotidyltransferase